MPLLRRCYTFDFDDFLRFVYSCEVFHLPQPSRQMVVIASIAILAISIVFVTQRILTHYLNSAQDDVGREVAFVVEQEESVNSIATRLHADGLIRSPSYFRFLVGFSGDDKDIVAGEHTLNTGMTTSQIIDTLTSEDAASTQEVTVQFIEGWRSEQYAEALIEAGLIATVDDFMNATRLARWNNEFDFLHTRPSGVGLEGYLFPDTYIFRTDSTPEDIISVLLQTFDDRVPLNLRTGAAAIGLTLHQTITLASIIEREAAVEEERPVISSVYTNRIIANMPLQADPTVQYELGAPGDWWPVLTPEDLRRDGRYNTYLNPNLPPGPICNPGLASIEAAFDPADTDFLFFVATGDGSHAFATTFEEHERNIEQYR